jgi:hypothetical protein
MNYNMMVVCLKCIPTKKIHHQPPRRAFNGSSFTTFFSVGAAALGFTGVGCGGGGMVTSAILGC